MQGEKLLSAAGKEVLLKSVIQSIPTYIMSCFVLPINLCSDIHQLMASFWWGSKADERKIHWMAWSKLCTPKNEGGMGFRDLNIFNLSLLAKQGWRILMFPDSLVARVLKALYYPNSSFMNAVSCPGISYTWRSILAGREVLDRGIRYQVAWGMEIPFLYGMTRGFPSLITSDPSLYLWLGLTIGELAISLITKRGIG